MQCGDIYLVSFSKSIGHEYMGERPAVIIQSDGQLKKTSTITVMPLTSRVNNCHTDDILIRKNDANNLFCNSIVKVHHINSFDKSRFIKRIGKTDSEVLQNIKNYLKKHFDIIF